MDLLRPVASFHADGFKSFSICAGHSGQGVHEAFHAV